MLVNLMEKEVVHTLGKILDQMDDLCKCEKCRMDMAAIALNNLKPNYVVTEKGELYSKINQMNYQFNTDVVAALTSAIELVKNNPKHD